MTHPITHADLVRTLNAIGDSVPRFVQWKAHPSTPPEVIAWINADTELTIAEWLSCVVTGTHA